MAGFFSNLLSLFQCLCPHTKKRSRSFDLPSDIIEAFDSLRQDDIRGAKKIKAKQRVKIKGKSIFFKCTTKGEKPRGGFTLFLYLKGYLSPRKTASSKKFLKFCSSVDELELPQGSMRIVLEKEGLDLEKLDLEIVVKGIEEIITSHVILEDVHPNKVFLIQKSDDVSFMHQVANYVAARLAGAVFLSYTFPSSNPVDTLRFPITIQAGAFSLIERHPYISIEAQGSGKENNFLNSTYHVGPLNSISWKGEGILSILLPYERDPYPAEFTHYFNPKMPVTNLYWLTILEPVTQEGAYLEVTRTGNNVEIRCNITTLKVKMSFNERFVDFSEKVKVSVNKENIFEEKLRKKSPELCVTYGQTRDPFYTCAATETLSLTGKIHE